MNGGLPGRGELTPEGGILLLGHGAVYIVRRALVIPGRPEGALHIHALERDDRCHSVIKVHAGTAGAAEDGIGKGV